MQRYIQSPSSRLRWPSAPLKRAGEIARKTDAAQRRGVAQHDILD
jgi:hypothetical protein